MQCIDSTCVFPLVFWSRSSAFHPECSKAESTKRVCGTNAKRARAYTRRLFACGRAPVERCCPFVWECLRAERIGGGYQEVNLRYICDPVYRCGHVKSPLAREGREGECRGTFPLQVGDDRICSGISKSVLLLLCTHLLYLCARGGMKVCHYTWGAPPEQKHGFRLHKIPGTFLIAGDFFDVWASS